MTVATAEPTNSGETEFLEAELAVCMARLIVAGVLWCVALALVDRVAFRATDPFVANLRLGLWLYLVEILVATYGVRYTAPASYPLVKRTAFVLAEVIRQSRNVALQVAINLVVRWILVTLFTCLAVLLFGSSWLVGIAAFIPSISYLVAWLTGIAKIGTPAMIRGTHLGSYMEAVSKCAAISLALKRGIAEKMADQGMQDVDVNAIQLLTIPFGGLDLPLQIADPHFLLIGTTSSGKTLQMRMILSRLLLRFGHRRNRAIIHDAKREYLPLLIGMGIPPEHILLLNAADSRCTAWDIAADIRDRNDAVNIVRTLIPEDQRGQRGQDNPFFVLAVRAIVTEVFVCLHWLHPGRWRLIDALNAVRTPETLRRVLSTTPEGRETYQRYFGREAEEMVGGIIATIDARFIAEYETIARIWSRCAGAVALTSWVTSQKILLLGYDENSAGQDRINQAMFERAARLLCALPDDPEGNAELTIVGLDEPAFLPKLSMLSELISLGRTKGVRVLLAPQDLDGLYEKYGEHEANAILALCGNVAALRMLSNRTREWAAKFFGDYEAWQNDFSFSETYTYGGTHSSYSRTTGTTTKIVKRESILPSEFVSLPQTSRSNGMHGFFATPAIGAWRAAIPPAWLAEHLAPRDPETAPFIRRPDFAADPARWTAAEEQRFTTPKERTSAKPANSNGQAHKPGGNGKGRNEDGAGLPDW